MNLVSRVFDSAEKHKEIPALRWKNETWREMTYGETRMAALNLASALRAHGVKRGDRVAIYSPSCPDWVVADLAILACGGVTVPIYNTSTPDVVGYILDHAKAKVVLAAPGQHTQVSHSLKEKNFPDLSIFSFDAFASLQKQGAELGHAEIKSIYADIAETEVATLIYTSGTTGDPKGVMLTHENILSNCDSAKTFFPLKAGARSLSFLPLSHGFERMAGMYLMLLSGISISYVKDPTQMAPDLQEVRPAIMMVVPRVLEKFFARVQETAQNQPTWKQKLFWWGVQYAQDLDQAKMGKFDALRWLIDRTLFRKVRQGLGGKLELIVSGGAPLAPDIARFFCAVGMEVLEGYGLTETSPVVCVNRPGKIQIGTVGPPLPGVEVKLGDHQEILVRGPNIMKGYYMNPQATAEVIDSEGWFHTGDVGELTSDNFLKVTDRIKEIIVTSGGKNIAPQPLENGLILDPLIDQVCVIGDCRNYLTALIVPAFNLLERKARKENLEFTSHADLIGHPRIIEWMQAAVDRFNAKQSSFQTIKSFTLLSQPWSIEAGEITPTLKLKRRIINQVHAPQIDRMYKKD